MPERFLQLSQGHFVWGGHGELRLPYRIVRLTSKFAHIVACTGGEGRVVIDGQEVSWHPGQMLLAPSGQDHGFEIAGSEPWHLA
ncbi:MAG: AraC family ligand binding domain-containing protein [Candidatus Synoicihabitans palmerolidicus]|nr:AraC family ligand binding domain-containing protein [Candidatus Synoicihabitans palmerolidicus]